MDGLLFINKPAGITSFDCIRHIKALLPPKTKIGHSGALDPFASGLLILGIGKGTRMLDTTLNLDKTYTVKIKLGEQSDTLDCTGTITQRAPVPESIDFAGWATALGPEYIQAPPIYSNVKLNGQALHRIVRAGTMTQEELEAVAKERSKSCSILEIEVLAITAPFVTFTAKVSKGTYIRSLANDIAKQGGTIATTYELTRTAIGESSLESATSLEKFTNRMDIEAQLIKKTAFFDITFSSRCS